MTHFRRLTKGHREAVVTIYDHYVTHSFAAYPEMPVGGAFLDRILPLVENYPAWVLESEEGQILGFGFLRAWHPASSFRRTAEITYFLHPDHVGRGYGSLLLARLLDGATSAGIERVLASISSLNPESLAFHAKHGFTEVGRFPDVGLKQGTPFDVVWMMKTIDA